MIPRPLSKAERVDWLRLARSPGVGPVTFFELLKRYRTPKAALEALPRLAARGGRKGRKPAPLKDVQAEIAALEALGARLLCACEPEFPNRLRALDPPPPVISTMGPYDLDQPAVALVGARNASLAGRRFAQDLAHGLGERGYGVISGLARGLDAAAHEGALETGTAAVLAQGLDIVYPVENEALHQALAERGGLVSEAPPGRRPKAQDFPRRNRIISGLSLGVVVVEAALRSGSLITARYALEQGREVMAVPGSPLDPRARGANKLLREGAALIESGDDVITAISQIGRAPLGEPDRDLFDDQYDEDALEAAADRLRDRVLGVLTQAPVGRDAIAQDLDAPIGLVNAALVELELAGRIAVLPGGLVQRLDWGESPA
ncbi:MAG: DNA-processing protein DprA [Maricaulaceae bacterium]